ncbi:uncharacterized protein MYCFIDRAFT_169231 [Pseudocercospora fijiensis CIRAD86]|uniref:Uncharacterized protein n=1 Tax=Pseudocercospora fijiensis (strain CIRAD86) TaxID=383855 RepID=N1Q911_PSEFD|nr:uncharacterized protein MYCFIDRAFT_169231 [Pseudocercospora fijiensis CIRAD86]EME87397.1 hypothetical protein MYCFIDRAFT_169231 [Pseudocercospora fijiensis CIRAD86]
MKAWEWNKMLGHETFNDRNATTPSNPIRFLCPKPMPMPLHPIVEWLYFKEQYPHNSMNLYRHSDFSHLWLPFLFSLGGYLADLIISRMKFFFLLRLTSHQLMASIPRYLSLRGHHHHHRTPSSSLIAIPIRIAMHASISNHSFGRHVGKS